MSGKPWTDREREVVREFYGRMAPEDIAEGLERTASSVWQQAAKLGLARKKPRFDAHAKATLRRMAAEGACNRCIGRAIGHERHAVRHWRRRLGLPPVASRGPAATCRACIEKVREATRRQLAAAGLQSLGEVRVEAFKKFARANGWPEDLRPREVQILNVLAARGVPMTRPELAEAIGMRNDRMGANGTLALLCGSGPGGTYTASLVRRGLLAVMERGHTVHGRGRGRSRHLYFLGPQALAILGEQACQSKKASSA